MKTLKYEEVYRQEYRDLSDALRSLRRFIERVHNEKRLHSALGYLPPSEFETNLVVTNHRMKAAARQLLV
jgi:putative transposase